MAKSKQASDLGARRRAAAALISVMALLFPVLASSQNGAVEKSLYEGNQAMRGGQWDVAASCFSRVITLAPTFAEAHFNLGLARLQQGRWNDAIPSFEKSLALKPHLHGANLFLGIARYRKGEYADALAALKREAQSDPSNSKVFMWLGVAQLAAGDTAAASVSLDKAAALSPNDVDILYHRGRAHMLVSKESYEKMYKAAPDSWRVHQVLAQSFVEQNRLEEAVKECQIAIAARPREPGLHEQLADIYWQENLLAQAETEFQTELGIDPESVSSMYKLAVVSIERSKPEVAAEKLAEVLRRTPHNADAHYQLGRAEAQLGNLTAAISNFSTAVADSHEADSETVRQSYYQLAQLYRRQQKPEESQAALNSFIRLKQQADARQEEKLQDKLKRSSSTQEAQPQ
jgi:tetratricopeptide (TPR) repeat protein